MKTEYIVALIMVAGSIIVALINILVPILIRRPDSAAPESKELPPAEVPTKRSKWVWIFVIAAAVIGVSLWLFDIMISTDPLYDKTFKVSAEGGWQSSGVYIWEDNRVEVVYQNGGWSPRVDPLGKRIWTNADGTGSPIYSSEINLRASLGSLIAKIGENPPFETGRNKEFIADTAGQLFFRINDVNLDDNEGSITIRVRVWPP